MLSKASINADKKKRSRETAIENGDSILDVTSLNQEKAKQAIKACTNMKEISRSQRHASTKYKAKQIQSQRAKMARRY